MNSVDHILVGQFFRTFDNNGNRDFRGQILARPEPGYYLCQLFGLLGEPSCSKMALISEMMCWAFYATEDACLDADESNKNHSRALNAHRKEAPVNDVFSRRPEAAQ